MITIGVGSFSVSFSVSVHTGGLACRLGRHQQYIDDSQVRAVESGAMAVVMTCSLCRASTAATLSGALLRLSDWDGKRLKAAISR